MKKLTLLIALGLGLGSASAFAYDYDYNDHPRSAERSAYVRTDIGMRVDRLNRMLEHVRRQVDRYPTGGHLRYEVQHAANEVGRVNALYQRGFDSYRLNRKIDTVRSQLHHIEMQLHVRNNEWYRWD